ncbi:MAG TPA: helix-turn-helix domain-containing protein [Firmicutes bacterium]|nr:helix-turn-helix domain-containing protein [Bacillota bacterium]
MRKKLLYSVREVAKQTGLSTYAVYRLVRTGKLRALKSGRWLISAEAVKEALGVNIE